MFLSSTLVLLFFVEILQSGIFSFGCHLVPQSLPIIISELVYQVEWEKQHLRHKQARMVRFQETS
jgi:hypothetical protein